MMKAIKLVWEAVLVALFIFAAPWAIAVYFGALR